MITEKWLCFHACTVRPDMSIRIMGIYRTLLIWYDILIQYFPILLQQQQGFSGWNCYAMMRENQSKFCWDCTAVMFSIETLNNPILNHLPTTIEFNNTIALYGSDRIQFPGYYTAVDYSGGMNQSSVCWLPFWTSRLLFCLQISLIISLFLLSGGGV